MSSGNDIKEQNIECLCGQSFQDVNYETLLNRKMWSLIEGWWNIRSEENGFKLDFLCFVSSGKIDKPSLRCEKNLYCTFHFLFFNRIKGSD